ncbi:hypothetical protein Tco_1321276 [Tanacetum coccineum]
MATQASSTTIGVGSSSAPMVVKILPCTRKDDVWQHFNLSKMSDNTTKAQYLEEAIYDEEVKAGEAISLSDEEFTQDEASSEARSNGSEDEITFD